MSQPFISEIKMFGGNFAPRNYAFCNGQTVAISQNTALFSLIGVTFGGNGTTNFVLPNMQARRPLGVGNGPGLTPRAWGESSGVQNVTVLPTQIPAHSHNLQGTTVSGTSASPSGSVWALSGGTRSPYNVYASAQGTAVAMAPQALATAGSGMPHNNLSPYLGVNFIIALQGIFPSRN